MDILIIVDTLFHEKRIFNHNLNYLKTIDKRQFYTMGHKHEVRAALVSCNVLHLYSSPSSPVAGLSPQHAVSRCSFLALSPVVRCPFIGGLVHLATVSTVFL